MMTIGTLVAGRYEIRDRLGQGAQGVVFEAFDRLLGRLVALKILPLAGGSREERADRRHRFISEARAAARLQHPGIVTVYDSGEAGEDAWIAMELVIGQTLREALRRPDRPPLREALRIARELLDALDAAHARGVIHRDVKPCNILLAMDAGDGHGRVRLTDFGIASLAVGRKPEDIEFVGTPSVMAPEQIRGEACDERTDLWSAGVVLYELLTGTQPFAGAVPGIYAAVLARDPLPPTLLNPELPLAFDAVMAMALAKPIERRFQSAQEMSAAIDAAAGVQSPRRPGAAPLAAGPAAMGQVNAKRGGRALAFLAGAAVASAGFAWRDAGWPGWPGEAILATARTVAKRTDAMLTATLAAGRDATGAVAAEAGQPPPVNPPGADADTVVAQARRPVQVAAVAEPGPPVARVPAAAIMAAKPAGAAAVAEPGPPAPPSREPGSGVVGAAASPATVAETPAPHDTAAARIVVASATPRTESAPPGAGGALVAVAEPHAQAAADEVPTVAHDRSGRRAEAAAPDPIAPPAGAATPPARDDRPRAPLREAAISGDDRRMARPGTAAPTAPIASCIGAPPLVATGDHPGFGRVVLRWAQPVRYSAAPRPGGLRLEFAEPLCIAVGPAVRLPRNVRAVVGAPGVVEIDAAPGTTIRHFTLDRRTVIDVADLARR